MKKLNKKKLIMKIILVLIVSVSIIGGCSYVNKKLGLKDDNPIEEAIEEMVENRIGLDIDFTPDSKER